MTSEEIKSMQSAAAIDAANVVGKNDATYTSVMRNIYLAEIAYQLAVANERDKSDTARPTQRWRSRQVGHDIEVSFGSMTVLQCSCGWHKAIEPGASDRNIAHFCGAHYIEATT
jgi:hypothetical protein